MPTLSEYVISKLGELAENAGRIAGAAERIADAQERLATTAEENSRLLASNQSELGSVAELFESLSSRVGDDEPQV